MDSRGEHAIQEMLLTHPLAASGRMTINNGIPRLILFFSTLTVLFIYSGIFSLQKYLPKQTQKRLLSY